MPRKVLIKVRRGLQADLDKIILDIGEFGLTTDTNRLYIGTSIGNKEIGGVSDLSGYMAKSVYDTDNSGKVDHAKLADAVAWGNVTGKPSTFPPSSHNHDDRYYTESEVDTLLGGKSNTNHTHDSRYYTESEVDTLLEGYATAGHSHSWSSITSKPSTFAPSAHSHAWTDITGKPSTFTPSAHTHDDRYYTETEVDDLLAGKANSSHSHSWSSITSKPSTFPPATHSHTWESIEDKPTAFPPDSHSHAWGDITGKPTSFTPSAHSHAWSEITGKPSTFTPASHTHDDRYYTETEVDDLLAGKANSSHSHSQYLTGGLTWNALMGVK